VATALIGLSIDACTLQSTTSPRRVSRITTEPGSNCWPPAQVRRPERSSMRSAVSANVAPDGSSVYTFS